MSVFAKVDFPEPLSPTIPKVLFLKISKEMLSNALKNLGRVNRFLFSEKNTLKLLIENKID